jgi:hypothetical protein
MTTALQPANGVADLGWRLFMFVFRPFCMVTPWWWHVKTLRAAHEGQERCILLERRTVEFIAGCAIQ